MEEIFKSYKIEVVAYHGGDLVGNDISRVMDLSLEIFEEFDTVVRNLGQSQGLNENKLNDLSKRIYTLRDTLILFDKFFSLIAIPNYNLTVENKFEIKTVLNKAVMAWRCLKDNVPTKIHCLEDHLMEQIEQLGGLADYNEHFVEMEHQVDKKDMSRTRGVHDIVRKFKLHADWEERKNNKQVKVIILLVNKQTIIYGGIWKILHF